MVELKPVILKPLIKGQFKVGDKIKQSHTWHQLATITEITERGFKYKHDEVQNIHPRMGLSYQEGECFEGGFHLWELLSEYQTEFKY